MHREGHSIVVVLVSKSWPTLQPHGLYSPRNSPSQNTRVGSRSLLQEIFPTQGSNLGLPNCRWILYQMSGSSQPRNWTGVSCIARRFFTNWDIRGSTGNWGGGWWTWFSLVSIPGLGRSPGGGHGHPLQDSCLENPMDRGPWWATVHGVSKSRIWLSNEALHTLAQNTDAVYPPPWSQRHSSSLGAVAILIWACWHPWLPKRRKDHVSIPGWLKPSCRDSLRGLPQEGLLDF